MENISEPSVQKITISESSALNKINPADILKDFEMESVVDNAFVNMVLVDMTEYARHHSDKAVKKTLSIPMWLNTLCEEKVSALGIPLSHSPKLGAVFLCLKFESLKINTK